MSEITRQPCPNCPSSDAFAYNSVKMVGVCYSCGSAYPKAGRKYDQEILDKYPLEDKGFNSPVVVAENPPESLYKFVPMRGIAQDVMEFYNVRTLCTREGVPVQQEYIYPSGSKKTRRLPKSFTAVGKMDELFGMNLFVAGTSKMVTITEGELDAMSAWQMIGRGSRYPTPVVSLPSANPSKAFWENVIPWLDSFEKIVLSVDKDGAGDEVAQKINNIFPNKVYRVDHTLYKDANEFLQANKASEYKSAWYNAQRFMPDNILHSADDLLELFDETPDHSYVPTGIPEFDKKAMGLMQGHFTVFKAPTGIGKTELMRYLEWNFLQRGITFATMHLEETKLRSVLGLVSYDLKDNLTRKDLVEEKGKTDEVRASITRLGDSENYYQYFIKDGQGADELISQIRMFKEAYDCDYVLFEPVQDVISVGSEQNKEGLLAELAVRLSKVAADLNVGIITIAHTNEDNEIKYCKMLGQRASVIVRLDRDKEAEDFMDRNTTRLIIEKNRPTSEEGHAGDMLFDTSKFTMEAL
jgi:KaiC/GvpD/RAD55 family RecA-like ATPase